MAPKLSHFINLHIKELLVFTYILLGIEIYLDRLAELGISINAAIYILLFLFLVLSLLASAYIKNILVRLFFGVFFYISAVFMYTYRDITQGFLLYDKFIALIDSRGFIDNAIEQFAPSLIVAILFALLLFFGIVLRPRRKTKFSEISLIFTPVFAVALLSSMLFIRGGEGARGLPAPFIAISYLNLLVYDKLTTEKYTRTTVSISNSGNSNVFDIVYIIDESIAPNYLDINNENGVQTNLKRKNTHANIYNFGFAAAITNCSHNTNITLRYGGTRDKYKKINASMPSIWQYAKHANFNTVYIDTQMTGGKLHNGVNIEELKYINQFIQFDNTPVLMRDIVAAKKLTVLLNNNSQDFILVNKTGAHFPVHDKYPDNFMKYKPVLKRGNFLNINYTESREGFSNTDKEWMLYRNSYKNTLLWNVGEFFNILFTAPGIKNTVMIYTSDHGQDLNEKETHGKTTHCNPNPNIEEGIVPLVIIAGKNTHTLDWKKHLTQNRNASSHYNIFPTLLTLMSYNRDEVEDIYGLPLDKATNDPFTFNTKFNALFGRKPEWKKIDVDSIFIPQ